jgi:RNA polymerase-associated protein CTR9
MLAKNSKDPEIMYESLLNTQRAQELQPEDKSTMYNIALVQQQYAQLISDLPTVNRTSDVMRKAMDGLDNSQQLFRTLINVPEEEHVYYDRKMAEQRERFGETLRTQMDRKMLEQLQYEEQRESKLKEVKLRQEQREAQRRQDAQDKIQAEEDERLRLEEDRRKLMEKVREDNMMMAQRELEIQDDDQVKKSRSSSGKRQKNEDDGIDDDEEDEDSAPGKKVRTMQL